MKKKATKLKLRIGKWGTKPCHFVIIDSLHIPLRKMDHAGLLKLVSYIELTLDT